MELLSPRTWASPVQASHTNSRVWVSPLEKIQDRWLVVKDNLSRVRFDRSPFVPQDRPGYFEHLASQAEDLAKKEKKRLGHLEAERGGHHSWIIPFNGQSFSDNRSAVLAIPSIWSLWYKPPQGRPGAPWPTPDEFREEGDERHTSGFGRFLPLPRVPGNETVVWKQKVFLEPYDLDQVNPVFWREDTARFLEEAEQTLAENVMTELRGSNSDNGMKGEAGVFDQTVSTIDPEAGTYTSTSQQTENSHSGFRTASEMVQGTDSTPNPSLEPTSTFQYYPASLRYNSTLEFVPAAGGYPQRPMMSQLSPQNLSHHTDSRMFHGEDGIDVDELLCQKEANDIEPLPAGQLRSSLEPQVRGSVFDIHGLAQRYHQRRPVE
ncbi:hypothetical protein MMC32_004532 [Xylographa parallela]|nr:hypothetical protein [Xylographa parallela]